MDLSGVQKKKKAHGMLSVCWGDFSVKEWASPCKGVHPATRTVMCHRGGTKANAHDANILALIEVRQAHTQKTHRSRWGQSNTFRPKTNSDDFGGFWNLLADSNSMFVVVEIIF